MKRSVNELTMRLMIVFVTAAQTPGIADKQDHAEFVISRSEVSAWKSVVDSNGFSTRVQYVK